MISHSAEGETDRPVAENGADYVTVSAGGQAFGFPIERVHDVFVASALTHVPLAPPEVAGLLNLRGRVVTALCLKRLLGLPAPPSPGQDMAVGLEHDGESFGVIVDSVGEVMRLSPDSIETNPTHLDPCWTARSRGVHQLHDGLLVLLDVDSLLSAEAGPHAA
jgi:purine-binding chemotaxis protein CheW